MKKSLRIYIHIPFCVRKCHYCDFLSAAWGTKIQDAYVEVLLREITEKKDLLLERKISSVFIGGGTPSILEAKQILRILEQIKKYTDFEQEAEITIECNPGTVTKEKLQFYKEAGINRISFGLQSAQNEELKLLGRVHSWEDFLESYDLARTCGFSNMNIDLMSGLPGQTLERWEDTLKKVLLLEPEHISAYSLILEEGTPFFEKYGNHLELLPEEEEERKMYDRTQELLEQAGLERYEISNYARKGYACRHNLAYWEREEYLGLGLGAASLIENIRYSNQSDMNQYLLGNYSGTKEPLTDQAVMEEHFFLGLRKIQGVSIAPYEGVYDQVIEGLCHQGLLERTEDVIRLTKQGIDVSNYVMAEFLI